ncbi:MAG: biotin synthase BioB [bacterium]
MNFFTIFRNESYPPPENIYANLNLPLLELIFQANEVRKKYIGSRLDICSITNAKSGYCSEDCKFCAQSSRFPTSSLKYPLKNKGELIELARRAKDIGAQRFSIVTSGKKVKNDELLKIAEIISDIKDGVGITMCSSLGLLDRDDFTLLKQAGLSRYHHNLECSPRFFSDICTTHSLEDRIATIKSAKEAGLEVCSGGIIGMGEGWTDRIELAMLLKNLGVDAVSINILSPIKGTPLESINPIPCSDIIRTIAIFRIILEKTSIKIAAGRETILGDFQALAFLAGVNGMIIGGYLTVKGRDVEQDQRLIQEISALWKE